MVNKQKEFTKRLPGMDCAKLSDDPRMTKLIKEIAKFFMRFFFKPLNNSSDFFTILWHLYCHKIFNIKQLQIFIADSNHFLIGSNCLVCFSEILYSLVY